MNRKKQINSFYKYNKILLLLISIAILSMGIGYAAVNSITLDFNGKAIAKEVDGIYIIEAKYIRNVNADLSNSKINNAYKTNLSSTVILSNKDSNSSITYEITVYNSSDSDYSYIGPAFLLGDITYDNEDIVFNVAGINENDIIKSKQTKTFEITFQYNNNVLSNNNCLNSIINFKFELFVEMKSAGTLINVGSSSNGIFGSNLYKSNIEKIYFVDHINVPAGVNSWDASVEHDNSIIGWYVDSDNNGYYELYLGADDGRISFPADSSYMFSSFSQLKYIDFGNVDTSNVTNMNYMFYYLSSLKEIDLSNFDTSNVTNMNSMFYFSMSITEINFSSFNTSKVTNMGYMFYYCTGITELNLSNFDTSNVTNMAYMFTYSSKLAMIKLNNATFENVTQSGSMFYGLASNFYIITKDETTKSWLNSKLSYISANVVTVAELG